jgi:hypothetical protein
VRSRPYARLRAGTYGVDTEVSEAVWQQLLAGMSKLSSTADGVLAIVCQTMAESYGGTDMASSPPGTMTASGPVPTRPTGWPVLRTPKWMLAGAAVLVAGLVLAAIPHHPSTSERVADLRGVVGELNADIESCAGGVTESLSALSQIRSGTSNDISGAVSIATTGAANCSPANSMPMDDLVQYQVPSSLSSFHLQDAVNDLVTWAFPLAQRVQLDVATAVTAATPAATAGASAQLRRDQRALDAERASIDAMFDAASRALAANIAPPKLPGG